MDSLKNTITNVVALVAVLIGVVQTYIQTTGDQPINWIQLAGLVLVAVIGYFTGKKPDGSK